MSLLRSSTAVFTVAASAARTPAALAVRTITTSAVRHTDDPKVLNNDTHSGASVKADKHEKDPHTLQKEHTDAANNPSRTNSKYTASPNDSPTDSEDAVHSEKHDKHPEEMAKDTVKKLHN